MNLCRTRMVDPGSAGSIAFAVFFVACNLYLTWWAARAIRRRRFEIYRDPRHNPEGRAAIACGIVILIIAWSSTGLFAWAYVCGFVPR